MSHRLVTTGEKIPSSEDEADYASEIAWFSACRSLLCRCGVRRPGGSGLDAGGARTGVALDSGWTSVKASAADSGWTGAEATPADSGWTDVEAAAVPGDSGWTIISAGAEA